MKEKKRQVRKRKSPEKRNKGWKKRGREGQIGRRAVFLYSLWVKDKC